MAATSHERVGWKNLVHIIITSLPIFIFYLITSLQNLKNSCVKTCLQGQTGFLLNNVYNQSHGLGDAMYNTVQQLYYMEKSVVNKLDLWNSQNPVTTHIQSSVEGFCFLVQFRGANSGLPNSSQHITPVHTHTTCRHHTCHCCYKVHDLICTHL